MRVRGRGGLHSRKRCQGGDGVLGQQSGVAYRLKGRLPPLSSPDSGPKATPKAFAFANTSLNRTSNRQ